MDEKRIFIIEDETDIITLLEYNLKQEGFRVQYTETGEHAIEKIIKFNPHLVLLDLMVPVIDGFEICRQLKRNEKTNAIPIIIISAKTQEHNIISGIELGAEDYIVKPFSINVLITKIKAILRRKVVKEKKEIEQNKITQGELTIDPGKMNVKLKGVTIPLTTAEFKLLEHLAKNPGWVCSRDQLINSVKGENAIVIDRTIDVLITSIRKKLGPYANQIETVRGAGYRFKEE